MIVWICSFDVEATRQTICPAITVQWQIFCMKLTGLGLTEMQNQTKLDKSKAYKHFVHGLMEIQAGVPYTGPLTEWNDATFAQHELFGKANDAYSIKVAACHWFLAPVRVFTQRRRDKERHIQVRASCMAFYPFVLETLL